MRTTLACVALAAAIGTPGVVAGAISSQPRTFNADVAPIVVGSSQTIQVQPPPVAPELRPAVRAVRAAFAAKGIKLIAFPLGARAAEAVALAPGSRCPVDIRFSTTPQAIPLQRPACRFTPILLSKLQIDYSPPSVGPIVESAVANLR